MSPETQEQTAARLLRVIANAEFQVLPDRYAFEAIPGGPAQARPEALACVRDGDVWSQLIPGPASDVGSFTIFVFHFSPTLDATGFVGWLHSHLARTTGTGNIVICGKDRRSGRQFDHLRGGIFDYWGCPTARAEGVIAEVRLLIERGRAV